MISIAGLDKAQVLKALYDFSHDLDSPVPCDRTLEDFRQIIEAYGEVRFEHLFGRAIGVYIFHDEIDPWIYDRRNWV